MADGIELTPSAGGGSSTPSGSAGGDLTGTYPNPTIKSAVALTGNATAVTQSASDNSTKIATTAYVDTLGALKANLASPTFTGTPAAPTAAQLTNTTQVATTAFAYLQGRNHQRGGSSPKQSGLLAWTAPLETAFGTTKTLVAGQIWLAKMPVPETITITNIVTYVNIAGATLTSNQCFAGIYDSSGTRLAVTADQSASWNSAGLKTMTITADAGGGSTITVTGGDGTFVWLAFLSNGTTQPTFFSANAGGATGTIQTEIMNFNLSASAANAAVNGTSKTSLTSPSITPASNVIQLSRIFAGVS